MLQPPSVSPKSKREALVEHLIDNVLLRIRQGTFTLPSMPVSAFDCLELLRKPDFKVSAAAKVIEADLALAARVLSVTNSAAFCVKEKARSISQAVTRLGATNLRLVLFEAMAVPIYESSDQRIRKACIAVWQHSRAVAMSARSVATLCKGDPGEAYLAGLLHDIGKPIIASLLVQSEHRLVGSQTGLWLQPDAWLDVVQSAHRTAGVALARKWQLPESVLSAAANSTTYDDVAPRSIANCVRLANALAKEAGLYVGKTDPEQVAAVVQAGQVALSVADADLQRLRAEVRSPVRW